MRHINLACGIALSAALGLAPLAARADGGCSADIATLGKQIGSKSGLGAPVSEPDTGQDVGKANTASMNQAASSDTGNKSGTNVAKGGSPGTVGGAAGSVGGGALNKQADAVASGQVATSSADVRRQSAGKPTMAQQAVQDNGKGSSGNVMASEDKVSQAKAALQRATDLNAKGDKGCAKAVTEARNLLPQH
ncbi:MAG: hypothetical protein ACRYG6_01180 [Janthinobacterium lividum]